MRTVWAPLLSELGIKVSAIIDPDPDARALLLQQHPDARLFDEPGPHTWAGADIAFICSPNALHVEHALQALQAGLHAIVEKPACFSVCEANRLIDASSLAQRAVLTTQASSFRRDTRQMLALGHEGLLGQVQAIDLAWRRASGIPRPGSWFTRTALACGGSGADLGWHLLEIGLGLLSFPLVTSAMSQRVQVPSATASDNATWRNDEAMSGAGAIEVDTQMYAAFQVAAGPMLRLTTAWSSHETVDETCIDVFASRAQIHLRTTFGFSSNRIEQPSLIVRNAAGEQSLPCNDERPAPYRRFLEYALDYLGGPEPLQDPRTQGHRRQLRSLGSAMQALYPFAVPVKLGTLAHG